MPLRRCRRLLLARGVDWLRAAKAKVSFGSARPRRRIGLDPPLPLDVLAVGAEPALIMDGMVHLLDTDQRIPHSVTAERYAPVCLDKANGPIGALALQNGLGWEV